MRTSFLSGRVTHGRIPSAVSVRARVMLPMAFVTKWMKDNSLEVVPEGLPLAATLSRLCHLAYGQGEQLGSLPKPEGLPLAAQIAH